MQLTLDSKNFPPIIGIVATYEPEEDIVRLKQNYCRAIEDWGGMPFVLPLTDDIRMYEYLLPQIDGFLFTGGHDISPEYYGQQKHTDKLSPLTPKRDRMEARILNYAYDYDIPVLGVCRGMQMINVHFGGTLYQDLSEEYESIGGNKWALEGIYIPDDEVVAVEAHEDSAEATDAKGTGEVKLKSTPALKFQNEPLSIKDIERALCPGCVYEGCGHASCVQDKENMVRTTLEHNIMQSSVATHLKHWQKDHYECPSHFVNIEPDSKLGHILKTDHLAVNSMHHQGIKEVAPTLRAVAHATDGLVEAIEMPERLFFIGTQWHPEFFRVRMGLLFKAFIDASHKRYNERLQDGLTCRITPAHPINIRGHEK